MGNDKSYMLLVLNMGSTSTKISVYRDETCLDSTTINYDSAELERNYKTIIDQRDMRIEGIANFLEQAGYHLEMFDAVICRGCMAKPVPEGVYEITEDYIADSLIVGGFHPVALCIRAGRDIANELGIPCFTVDPPSLDELSDVARISGLPEIQREAQYHPLNHKRIARLWSKNKGVAYEDVNLIVVHMGGGITVGAHKHGRIVDVSSGNLGEGPMTPERPGTIPLAPVIRECYSGQYTQEEMLYRVYHGGGVKAYLGTSDMAKIEEWIAQGDEKAKLVMDAMIYQVAKEIGAMHTVLDCLTDAIILTGGAAKSEYVTEGIIRRVKKLAPVAIMAGDDEAGALVSGVMSCLRGEQKPKVYAEENGPFIRQETIRRMFSPDARPLVELPEDPDAL